MSRPLVWLLVYVALGHAGIRWVPFPGTFFALVWLPSGIALAWLCLRGQRALPWVIAASALVNAPYALAEVARVGVWNVVLVVLAAPLIDGLQAWLAWRLWRHAPDQPWTGQVLARFLYALLMAATVSTVLFAGLYYGAGMLRVAAAADVWAVLSQRFLMMVLADAQGMFLAVPVLLAVFALGARRQWRRLAGTVLLVPLPLLLAQLEPSLSTLLFPLSACIIIHQRFAGAATLVATAGIAVVVLTALGWSPLPMAHGAAAFTQWSLLIMALGTPLLMLGLVLDENRLYRNELESQVDARTAELRTALADAQWLATTDTLTGVMNRRHIESVVDRDLARVERYPQAASVIGFDIDHFKKVNDLHGHDAGDRVLQDVCTCVQAVLRASDALGRWGGEEFLVLLPHTELNEAVLVAEKIRLAVANQDFRIGRMVTLSLGVACYRKGEGRDAWLARADQSLYEAKHRGRNCVVCAY